MWQHSYDGQNCAQDRNAYTNKAKATILKDWGWANPTYTFKTAKAVKSVAIDKSKLMADINEGNNSLQIE